MTIDPGDEKAQRAYITEQKEAALGSPLALTPTDAIVLLTDWHEDEVTDVEEAFVYAKRLIDTLNGAGFSIVRHTELSTLRARPWGEEED